MIELKGNTYKLKYTLRGLFLYEQIAGVPFTPDKTMNVFLLIFCVLIANNDDFDLSFEDFTNVLDDEPKKIQELMKWMNTETERMNLLSGDEPSEGEKKKANDPGNISDTDG